MRQKLAECGYINPFGTIVCNANHINARGELRPTGENAGIAKKRALWAVSSTGLILIEAPSPAYHRGMLIAGNYHSQRGGDLMRFYTKQHPFSWGIDLHARTMDVCILDQAGETLAHSPASKRPSPMTPIPGICGKRCPASASSSASCCSTQSIRSTVARGRRILPPIAVWASAPRQRRGNVPAPPAPQSARRLSRGLSPKPPSYASGILRQDKNSSHDWRTSIVKARHCLS